MAKLPHVLAVPFPAQGHVMPLMEFSHRLADHGIKVTFVNIESIHQKLVSTLNEHKHENMDSLIHLVSIPDGLTVVDNHPGSRNPVDMIMDSMTVHLEELIKKMNESDDDKIDFVVADASAGSALEIAEKFGIERAAFSPAPLGILAFMLHVPKLMEVGDMDDTGNVMKEEAIKLPPCMPAMTTVDLMWGSDPFMRSMMFSFIFSANKAAKFANWIIGNSCYELEPASHDFIPNLLTIGPLLASERLDHPAGHLLPVDTTCLTWLDQQPIKSVIYVAFGSHTIFNQSQFDELVHGLELVNQPFLWVVRPGLVDELSAAYSVDFKERIAHIGKLVDWAPQQKVLAHPSVACFVTHCGWNSTTEGVSMGVPLLTWPYVADQFHNQNYICDIWKVGLRLDKDENGIVTRYEIKTKVHELLGDEDIRARVTKLKDMARKNVSEGGSSSKNLEEFIRKIKH